jgi:hypothetical protein
MAAIYDANPDYPHEIVTLEDVPKFILYRTYSPECEDHRIVVRDWRHVCDTYYAAMSDCEEAETAFEEAEQAFFTADNAHDASRPHALAASPGSTLTTRPFASARQRQTCFAGALLTWNAPN